MSLIAFKLSLLLWLLDKPLIRHGLNLKINSSLVLFQPHTQLAAIDPNILPGFDGTFLFPLFCSTKPHQRLLPSSFRTSSVHQSWLSKKWATPCFLRSPFPCNQLALSMPPGSNIASEAPPGEQFFSPHGHNPPSIALRYFSR